MVTALVHPRDHALTDGGFRESRISRDANDSLDVNHIQWRAGEGARGRSGPRARTCDASYNCSPRARRVRLQPFRCTKGVGIAPSLIPMSLPFLTHESCSFPYARSDLSSLVTHPQQARAAT